MKKGRRIVSMIMCLILLITALPLTGRAELLQQPTNFNGHTYKLITQKMTWHDAEAYCTLLGGHLVTITSKKENDYIRSLISQSTMIGLSDAQKEGIWRWVTDEPVSYTNWAKNEPNNEANEDYALMRVDGTWNDGHLEREKRPFVCEWDDYNEESQKTEQAQYLQQHINFVNSKTYNTVSNDFRYATILWNNYHGSTSQAAAEFVYDIQEGFFETISFQGMSSLENPYDAILLDLLSSKAVNDSLSDIVDSNAISVIDDVVGDLITMFQADGDWADVNVADNFKDLLDTESSDYSSNKLYQSLNKLFDGKSKDQISSLFSKYECYSYVLSNISDAAKGVDYFLEVLKYIASIEAYYNTSVEFKAILKEVADVMPSVNETYGEKFIETYTNYSSCVDYNSVMQNVLNHTAKEGFWLVTELMSDVLQDSALTFCKTALEMSESAASTLIASLWAAETGFNLGNMITKNDTLMNCRRLLRANYMLDEAVHHVMGTHAFALKTTPSYEEALYFDAAFNLFKNLQLSSLQLHQTYMEANGSSFINFLLGKQDYFNREVQAKAVVIDTWKNINCHEENSSNGVIYTKSNTVAVACPADVYVFSKSDGSLVASVIDDEVYNTDSTLTVVTESKEKAICFPNVNEYEVKIQATDVGAMTIDYTVNSLEGVNRERVVRFDNVTLDEESKFDFQMNSDNGEVLLIDQNQSIILPDLDTADLAFKGASLSLQHNLAINYKVDKALFEEVGYTNPYVVFELNGVKTKVSNYSLSGDRYVFAFRNIAPNQMNDTIKATLYATYNGVEYASATREYSVAEYCYSMLELYSTNEYAELRTLLVDLLHYGAASQTYTGYRTDALVNAALTAEQLRWGTSEEPALDTVLDTAYKTVENPLAKWKGAGLNLQDSVTMRLKFEADSIEDLSVVVESGASKWVIHSDKFVEEDGVYYVYFTGLDAGQMRQSVYLTICEGNTPVSNTVCYSIGSYAYEKQNSTIAGLPELVKAMMKYGDSAYAYVH